MRNVEFKAELRDMGLARAIAQALGARLAEIVEQTDTYYKMPGARLKRRVTPSAPTEFIEYRRADGIRPRRSEYRRFTEAEALERYGHREMRVWAVVRKVREVFLIENVRIHLDEVEGLGRFIEFEAVVEDGSDAASCESAVESLRGAFGPAMGEAIGVGYSDLVSVG